MKVIITESQYKKILSEQSNVYDDDISYQKALKIYNQIWKTYNDSVKYYNFIKNLGDINAMNAETWTEDGFSRLFNNSTKKTTANSLRKKELLKEKNVPEGKIFPDYRVKIPDLAVINSVQGKSCF